MRLATIWTMPAMSTRERLSRTAETATRALARRLPKRLAYWSFIHPGAKHMHETETVPEVRYVDVLARIDPGN